MTCPAAPSGFEKPEAPVASPAGRIAAPNRARCTRPADGGVQTLRLPDLLNLLQLQTVRTSAAGAGRELMHPHAGPAVEASPPAPASAIPGRPGLPGMPSAPGSPSAPSTPSVGVPSSPLSGSSTPFDIRAKRAEYCQCGARYTATAAERIPTLHGRGRVEGGRAGTDPADAAVSTDGWGADRPTRSLPHRFRIHQRHRRHRTPRRPQVPPVAPQRQWHPPPAPALRPRRPYHLGPPATPPPAAPVASAGPVGSGIAPAAGGRCRRRRSPCARACFGRPRAAGGSRCRRDRRCAAPPFDR